MSTSLSFTNAFQTLSVDHLSVTKSAILETRVIYARSTGNDANGDGSLANPYRTFVRAIQDLPVFSNNTIWYIDITGIGVETLTEKFYMPPFSAAFTERLVVSPPIYLHYIIESALNIVAVPTTLVTFTPTATATHSTTDQRTYTDNSKNWTADQFKGKFLIGSAGAETAVIYANDNDTLFTTHPSNFTSPLTIVEPSAELSFGPTVDTYWEGAFAMQSVSASVTFGGIKFSRNSVAGRTVIINSKGIVNCTLCDFQDLSLLYGGGYTVFDANRVGVSFAQDGVGLTMRYAFFDGSTFEAHGDGAVGTDFWFSCRFEEMLNALGHGGNNEAEMAYHFKKCSTISGTTNGFVYRGGARSRIESCEIVDCAASAILAESPGYLRVIGTVGTGNVGYGLEVTNGSQVQIDSATLVVGTISDVKVGVLPAEDWATFRTGFPADVDLTATSGTLSRVFQV